jgi:hypothetical protein
LIHGVADHLLRSLRQASKDRGERRVQMTELPGGSSEGWTAWGAAGRLEPEGVA